MKGSAPPATSPGAAPLNTKGGNCSAICRRGFDTFKGLIIIHWHVATVHVQHILYRILLSAICVHNQVAAAQVSGVIHSNGDHLAEAAVLLLHQCIWQDSASRGDAVHVPPLLMLAADDC